MEENLGAQKVSRFISCGWKVFLVSANSMSRGLVEITQQRRLIGNIAFQKSPFSFEERSTYTYDTCCSRASLRRRRDSQTPVKRQQARIR